MMMGWLYVLIVVIVVLIGCVLASFVLMLWVVFEDDTRTRRRSRQQARASAKLPPGDLECLLRDAAGTKPGQKTMTAARIVNETEEYIDIAMDSVWIEGVEAEANTLADLASRYRELHTAVTNADPDVVRRVNAELIKQAKHRSDG